VIWRFILLILLKKRGKDTKTRLAFVLFRKNKLKLI